MGGVGARAGSGGGGGGGPTESQTMSFLNPFKSPRKYSFFRVPWIITSVLLTQSS